MLVFWWYYNVQGVMIILLLKTKKRKIILYITRILTKILIDFGNSYIFKRQKKRNTETWWHSSKQYE